MTQKAVLFSLLLILLVLLIEHSTILPQMFGTVGTAVPARFVPVGIQRILLTAVVRSLH